MIVAAFVGGMFVGAFVGMVTVGVLSAGARADLVDEIVRLNDEPKPGDVYTYPASPRVAP